MHYDKWSAGLERKFKARGWELLGRGLNSTVLGKGPYAIKISNGYDRWEDYILWATVAGYAGGFAPRVYRCHRSKNGLVALMERLDRKPNRAPRGGFSQFLQLVKRLDFADDITRKNVMYRNGLPVLIDPALKYTDREPGRWRAVGSNILWGPCARATNLTAAGPG